MKPSLRSAVLSYAEQVAHLVPEESQAILTALTKMLMSQLETGAPAAPGKRGPVSAGVTVTVGEFGCIICDDHASAAKLLGCSTNSLSVRLSQGGGKWIFARAHPDTGNPMTITVQRGKLFDSSALAMDAWETFPAPSSRTESVARLPAQPSRTKQARRRILEGQE